MPSLTLRLPRRRDGAPTLRERATALKASAARVIRKPAPLPEPGSPEAVEAFAAACREHTRLGAIDGDYADLKRTPLEWWTKHTLSRAREAGEISAAECARLYPLASERELRLATIEHRLNLGALHALAFANDLPMPPEGETDDAEISPPPSLTPADTASPDAELLALGQRFEEAHAAWMACLPAYHAAVLQLEAMKVRCTARGLSPRDAEAAAYMQDGVDEALTLQGDLFEALEPINRAITALPALTVAGLAVKARSAMVGLWPNGDYESERHLGEAEDWGLRLARDLIDACATLVRRDAAGAGPWHGRIEKNAQDLDDGTVLFEDATGKLFREPVSHWIASTVQRLYAVARKEMNRQFNAECGRLDEAEREALHSRLQRDLRLDALGDAAFRSREIFQAAEAKRRGESREPPAPEDVLSHFDLGAMPLRELHTMHRHASALRHMACGLESMPSSTWGGDDGALNPAGRFAEWVGDMGCEIMDACEKEMIGRAPAEGDEEGRLGMIAAHVITYGDADQQRALAGDILALADRG